MTTFTGEMISSFDIIGDQGVANARKVFSAMGCLFYESQSWQRCNAALLIKTIFRNGPDALVTTRAEPPLTASASSRVAVASAIVPNSDFAACLKSDRAKRRSVEILQCYVKLWASFDQSHSRLRG